MKFICLEGIQHKNRFYTSYDGSSEPEKLANGTVAYTVLGYADTDKEAREILYGPNCDEPLNAFYRFAEYLTKMPLQELGISNRDVFNLAMTLADKEKE